MIINNPFNGKLNLDVAEYRISNGDYIDALNITKDAQGRGQDRVVSNILGNTLIPYTLPEGTNKIIGFFPDKVRNRAYYFLWNDLGYNSILYYDVDANNVIKVLESKTDSNGVDILNFNPSYKVLSVNIFYRDEEGDILYFNDSYNPPRNINVINVYGTSWKAEYLLVAKAPPVMPPKVTYENDENITINNLRNKLFQFSYRFVYDNNEKSVWSSKSIVPLPQQPTLTLTYNVATDNSRIAVVFSTGGDDVKAIELAFRETTNGVTSDWYLIKSFNKQDLSINDNEVYNFNFYNDSIYTQLDVIDTTQLQDWVPQRANAGELANGNVLLYAGILEGYDKTNMDLTADVSVQLADGFYYDSCGLLFFATVNGIDNGTSSVMDIYVYGTGTNTDNIVSELNNSAGAYCINAYALDNSDLSISYVSPSPVISVATLLAGISTELQSKGFTEDLLENNHLRVTYPDPMILTSSGIKYSIASLDNTEFANVWNSGYQYAIQYFDAEGRTIGAQTSDLATVNTPSRDLDKKFPQINLEIHNKPPLYAKYYQVLRSNNTTYNKRLCWVSESAYAGISSIIDQSRYFYIGIGNIAVYNESISSTQNVVSYNYTEGDRIKFIRRYDADNTAQDIPEQFDYEIVGTVSSFEYNIDTTPADYNTYTANGNFLKIKYPSDDISVDFKFPGTADWQHYEILLYNYTNNAVANQRFYYEFGKQFGIGNPGTEDRYHFGYTQLENGGAIVSVSNGDLFYRKRNVIYSDAFNYTSDFVNVEVISPNDSQAFSLGIEVSPTVDNDSYRIQSQILGDASLDVGSGPTWVDNTYLFYNKSTTNSKNISINGSFNVQCNHDTVFSLYAIVCSNLVPFDPKTLISLLPNTLNNLSEGVSATFDIKKEFLVPPTGKVWIVANFTRIDFSTVTLSLSPINFDFNVVKNKEIEIIESSFNDTYNLITNSNGRPSVIDENAKQTYFPTVIRFGQAYQSNTNLNATNRFYYEDFDEYDRTFGDVMRLHVRDRYLKVYQQFKVGNVPILTQIIKDVTGNPLQANSNQLINKIQYYAGDYGIGDAATSLAWNNFADYFVDNFRGVVCRLSQDGITPLSIIYNTNAFFVPILKAYRQNLNNGIAPEGQVYTGNPCIYGVFDAYTNKYIIAMEEINRYSASCDYNGGSAVMIPFECGYNGGSAIIAPYNCEFNGGSAVIFTPPGDYDYYLADEYSCDFPGCTLTQTNVLVAFPVGFSYIGSHFYSDLGHTGVVYKINYSSSLGVAVILDTLGSSVNCSLACGA
jgi:hypothetical protein